jgi:N-acetylmuramoyl-L-alanine amidase
MSTRRTDRTDRLKHARKRRLIVGAAVGMLLASAALAAIGIRLSSVAPLPASVADAATDAPVATQSEESTPSAARDATQTPVGVVEVPDVTGMTPHEAEAVLVAAGFAVTVGEAEEPSGATKRELVTATDPAPGARVSQGTMVTILVPAGSRVVNATSGGLVICIDPGHQAQSDLSPEPIGPGASETKERVRGGATGTTTKIPEYEVVLQIASNLKAELEERGYTVVLTRDTNDVNISNAERAQMANEAQADLFIRIHADGSTDPSVAGISTLYPGPNQWTKPIVTPSENAARSIQEAVIASTGAVSRGVVARTDLSGFNWCTVPAVLVECGFMSNAVEDRLLASPHYQTKLAAGIAAGVDAHFGR